MATLLGIVLVGVRLSVALVFILLSSHHVVVAGEYVVEISGTQGLPIGGKCLLISETKSVGYDVSGTVPVTLEYSGDLISCAIQRKAGTGDLRLVIKDKGGRVVAESGEMQPFGVVMAGGR